MHNRLTVDTMAPTQMEPSHERRGYAADEGDEEYFDRLDSKRCVTLLQGMDARYTLELISLITVIYTPCRHFQRIYVCINTVFSLLCSFL